jgi:hypothetical protein
MMNVSIDGFGLILDTLHCPFDASRSFPHCAWRDDDDDDDDDARKHFQDCRLHTTNGQVGSPG